MKLEHVTPFRQTQELTSAKLNELVTAVNGLIDIYNRVETLLVSIEASRSTMSKEVQAFITQYGTIITQTPHIVELMSNYISLADESITWEEGV